MARIWSWPELGYFTLMVTYPYAYMTYIVSPLAGLGGRQPTACYALLYHLNVLPTHAVGK